MDLLKALTGKNPAEYEAAAKELVDKPDVELFQKLVKQDDFLFDFVKNNVAQRIQRACNKNNYLNLFELMNYYSPSYESVIAEVLHQFGNQACTQRVIELYKNGNESQKAYAAKYLNYLEYKELEPLIPLIRESAVSEFEPLAVNSIEILSKIKDTVSKDMAIEKLNSEDEFEQFNAIKFLVTYGAKDTLPKIFGVMKRSSLSENIAAEIPYLMDLEKLLESNMDGAILILCNIVSAIPEIVPLSSVIDYNLLEIFENLYYNNLTSSSALLLRMSKEKFESLCENEEYLFDCDKNTKDEIYNIADFFKEVNEDKLNSLLYDELYDESDFVFFAVDYVNEVEELETLLDSNNQTLLLKVLITLKDKQALSQEHKDLALSHITSNDIKQIVELL